MSIITLTTDLGTKDYTVAAIKGRLLSELDTVTIIDITHEISSYNIMESAFVLKASYPNFPKNSIHIIGVDAEMNAVHKHLIVKLDNQFFIGADNGVFSLLSNNNTFDEIIEIHHPKSENSSFPTLDVFVDVAAEIAKGTPLKNIGTSINKVKDCVVSKPVTNIDNRLLGNIIYIDHYGNVITDISKSIFNQFNENKKRFEIIASTARINKIYTNYSELIDYSLPESQRQRAGKAMAIFNSLDLLEIALYKSNPNNGGSAASLLGLKVGDSIQIIFDN